MTSAWGILENATHHSDLGLTDRADERMPALKHILSALALYESPRGRLACCISFDVQNLYRLQELLLVGLTAEDVKIIAKGATAMACPADH